MVKVKYLMWLRDKIGVSEEEYSSKESLTLEKLVAKIIEKHPELKKNLAKIFEKENPIIILVNGKREKPDYLLKENDEVTIIPPVSGG